MVNTEAFFPFNKLFFPVWFSPFVLHDLFPGERFLLKVSSHMCRCIQTCLRYAAPHCKCKMSEIVSLSGSSGFHWVRSLCYGLVHCVVRKLWVRSAGRGGGNLTVCLWSVPWMYSFHIFIIKVQHFSPSCNQRIPDETERTVHHHCGVSPVLVVLSCLEKSSNDLNFSIFLLREKPEQHVRAPPTGPFRHFSARCLLRSLEQVLTHTQGLLPLGRSAETFMDRWNVLICPNCQGWLFIHDTIIRKH